MTDGQRASALATLDDVLPEAASRNAVIELHRSTDVLVIPTARARLLALDDEFLYLDSPQIIGRDIVLKEGQPFHCYVTIHDMIYAFTSKIASLACAIQLNQDKVVQGVSIERPRSVRVGQRRQNFRTSVAMFEPIRVFVHEAGREAPEVIPIEAAHFEGALMDASSGGVGVRIERLIPTAFEIYGRYFVGLDLPDGIGQMNLLAELRHARPLHEHGWTKLGLMFLPWPTLGQMQRQIRPLDRFLAQVQRHGRAA